MSADKAAEIRHVIAFIAAAYPVPSWEVETMRLYAEMLVDIQPAVLKSAATEWVKTSPERPSVAELRTASANMRNRMRREIRRRRELCAVVESEPEVLAEYVDVRQLLSTTRKRIAGRSIALLTGPVDATPTDQPEVRGAPALRQREERKRLLAAQAAALRGQP